MNIRNKKGQISTEYIIVFGIAFLIIVGGVFAFMKFAKSGTLTQESCTIATGMQKCVASSITEGNIQIGIENIGDPITVTSAKAKVGATDCKVPPPPPPPPPPATAIAIATGGKADFTLACDPALTAGTKVDTDFTIKYTSGGSSIEQTITGHLTGTVS
ncbi:MAG: hypothetical protein ABIG89_03125 [Candidatus Woesearchaeota archaeon]